MSENITSNSSVLQVDQLQLVINIMYVITGSCSAIGNFIIIALILSQKTIRRNELLILVGQATGDALYGIGFFLGGAIRLHMVLHNLQSQLVSPWYCQQQLMNFFYVFGPQLSSLMNVAISVDRLIAVTMMDDYSTLTINYALGVIVAVVIFVTVSYSVGFYLASTMDRSPSVSALCLSTQSSLPSYGIYYTSLIASADCAATVIYCLVMIILRYQTKQTLPATVYDAQQKRQIRLTKVLAFIMILDFMFDVIPWIVQLSINASELPENIVKIISPVTWIVIQFKRTITVGVFIWKFKELRQAFVKKFRIHKTVQLIP